MALQLVTSNTETSKKASNTSTSARNNRSNKKSPNEKMVDAIIGYIKVKEAEAVQLHESFVKCGAGTVHAVTVVKGEN